MPAVFSIQKAKKREGGWFHPRDGVFVSDREDEVFVFEATDIDTDTKLVSFILDRHCLEQIHDNMEKAMFNDPLRVRKCLS